MINSKFQVFAVTHRGLGGNGSGVSIVVAPTEELARFSMEHYFKGKKDGYRQFVSAALLEVQPYDESIFASYPFTDREPGVRVEYKLREMGEAGEGQPDEVVYLACDVNKLADELDQAQKKQHQGRGVSCVRTLIMFLMQGQLTRARACASNEGDKIRSYAEVVAILKKVGFVYEPDFSKL